MKKQLPAWAALLIITLIAGLALGCTYSLTKDPIALQNKLKAENARKAVLPLADRFEALPQQVYNAKTEGFAGPIYVEYTLDDQKNIKTLIIGNSQFAETEGLGAKAREPEFIGQFIGKSLPLAEGDIDAISHATITTNAVVEAVNTAELKPVKVDWCYAGYQGDTLVGYVAQTTVQGFGGAVEVIVGVDCNLTLTGVSVGGSNFSETAGLGAKAKDTAFTSRFIGKKAPVTIIKAGGKAADNTVDAITAATITSNAVAGAVNTAASHVNGLLNPGMDDAIVMPEKPAGAQVYSASVKGFRSPVYVEFTLDAAGKISYILIGDDQFAESSGYGAKAQDPAFMYQFIGKAAPLTLDDVDAISGATITTQAVVNAINAAMGQEVPDSATTATGDTATSATGDAATTATGDAATSATGDAATTATGDAATTATGDAATSATGDASTTATGDAATTATGDAATSATGEGGEAAAPVNAGKTADGAYYASVQGYKGPVYVEITVDSENKIASLKIGDENFVETGFLGGKVLEDSFIQQFIGKEPPLALSDIDAVSKATVTSQAVVDAINQAYEASRGGVPAANPTGDAATTATGDAATTATGDAATSATGDAATSATGDAATTATGDAATSSTGDAATSATGDTATSATGDAATSATGDAATSATGEGGEASAPVNAGKTADGAYYASVQGYKGPVYVEITVDSENKIASLKIGDENFVETGFLGGKVLEDSFIQQFIGKEPPLALSDIDAVSKATVTSQAVVDAINQAYEASRGGVPAANPTDDAATSATGDAATTATGDADTEAVVPQATQDADAQTTATAQ